MTNYVTIFIVGMIIGIILMAIITAANNIQWGCRDNTKSEEQEILDQLKASEFGIIRISDDNYDIVKVSDDLFYIKRRNRV